MTDIERLAHQVQEEKKNLEKKTMNIREMAMVMGCGETKAKKIAKTPGFPLIKIGNRYIIPIASFEEWLNSQALGCRF